MKTKNYFSKEDFIMKPATREITRVAVRDDKVTSKGKGLIAVGAVLGLIGWGVYKSGIKWHTPDEFVDLVKTDVESEEFAE